MFYENTNHIWKSLQGIICGLIIYMKKSLDCEWLGEMQFLGNTVQKRVITMTFWLVNKQRNSLRATQMSHLNGAKFGSTLDQFRAKTAMVCVSSTFAFATETLKELKTALKRKHCRKHWFLALFLEELVRREENYWWNRKLWARWP